MNLLDLHWLPPKSDFKAVLTALRGERDPMSRLQTIIDLTRHRADFLQTNQTDRAWLTTKAALGSSASLQRFRLAILAGTTVDHLLPAIRVAGLRFGIDIDIYLGAYGQVRQEVHDPASALWAFQPDGVLILTSHQQASAGMHTARTWPDLDEQADRFVDEMRDVWNVVKERSSARILSSTVPLFSVPEFGNYDTLEPASLLSFQVALNGKLARAAAGNGVLLLDVAGWAARVGTQNWFDPALWHHAKQDVHPRAAPLFGDVVARMVAALLGRSRKCLVLDLDNTLWGGVIGDDGIEGIVLGQGNGSGEAFAAFQRYAKKLSERGIILAVCSKNDDAVVRHAFASHSEMLLRDGDFACVVANWDDKAGNIRNIARTLNIGVDSMVFADDNPAERALVRRELPQVAVPEMPEDPAYFPNVIADAGYFESSGVTAEDLSRSRQYQENLSRERLRAEATDMNSYLEGLDMALSVGPIDAVQLTRSVQLINKTNQFNLTTRRYSEGEIVELTQRNSTVALWGRLVDRFGDNGLITVVIAVPDEGTSWRIDTWLMSCRVLGRRVEQAMLQSVAERCRQLGATELRGEYIRTPKNGMVADHYAKLGFESVTASADRGIWRLQLDDYRPSQLPMTVKWHQ